MSAPATLILGAVPRIAVPVARSLAAHGIPVFCAAFGPEQRRISSRAIARCFVFPELAPDNSELLDRFLETIERERIDYLVPCNDSSLRYIAQHFARISQRAKPACPGPAVLRRVLDKNETLAIARRYAIPVPQEIAKGEAATLDRIASELQFPVVAKPSTKLKDAAFKVRYFAAVDDLARAVDQSPDFFEKYLIQEFCPGVGMGIELLMHGGEPRIMFQHRRLTEHPRSGGVSVVAMSQPSEERLAGMAVRLLKAIEWEGVAMVEFRYDPTTGRTALMEVNGRFWGSLGLSAVCGVDFPYAQWAYDHGLMPSLAAVASNGVRARWTAGVLSNIAEAKSGFWKELSRSLPELSPAIRDMLFQWSDPVPALQETAALTVHESKALAKAVARRLLPKQLRVDLALARQHGWSLVSLLRRRRERRLKGQAELPPNIRRVLFVCHGNIIRSALAERLFQKSLSSDAPIAVSSAGLFAKNGKVADPRAVEAAKSLFDLDLSSHAATALTERHVEEADAIFVMDRQNEMLLLKRYPGADSKLFLLGEFGPASKLAGFEIADPYIGTQEDVIASYRSISLCMRGVIERLQGTTK